MHYPFGHAPGCISEDSWRLGGDWLGTYNHRVPQWRTAARATVQQVDKRDRQVLQLCVWWRNCTFCKMLNLRRQRNRGDGLLQKFLEPPDARNLGSTHYGADYDFIDGNMEYLWAECELSDLVLDFSVRCALCSIDFALLSRHSHAQYVAMLLLSCSIMRQNEVTIWSALSGRQRCASSSAGLIEPWQRPPSQDVPLVPCPATDDADRWR